ncbi:hypothetical protein [Nonomuraea sp. NPDC050310]|uniref:hypothetical protein n=1 Tax=Nonomuraea sp. NPDC050310 TaxID=3154935 RepID=UPI0033C208E6
MAVTLQVDRVPLAELDAARVSSAQLERVVSFGAVAASDYLDLDWARTGLLWLSEKAGEPVESAMRRALDGDAAIDSAAGMGLGLYSQVSFLEPPSVVEVASVLAGLDVEVFLAALPVDLGESRAVMGGDFGRDPRGYLAGHLQALRSFFGKGASRGLAMMVWWD